MSNLKKIKTFFFVQFGSEEVSHNGFKPCFTFSPKEGHGTILRNAIFSRPGVNFVSINQYMQWVTEIPQVWSTERRTNGPSGLQTQRVELEKPFTAHSQFSRACLEVESEQSKKHSCASPYKAKQTELTGPTLISGERVEGLRRGPQSTLFFVREYGVEILLSCKYIFVLSQS